MHAVERKGRAGHRIGRFLGVLALTGTAVFAVTAVAAPPAYAEGGSNCSVALYLCTTIQYRGSYQSTPRDPDHPGGTDDSGGYVSSCWLQPETAYGDESQDASSPSGFENYLNDLEVGVHHDPDGQVWAQHIIDLYKTGAGADPGIVEYPPYNDTQAGKGRWYGIACDMDTFRLRDYIGIQVAMGVKGENLTKDYEAWFWLKNGKTPPAGVQTVTPAMLAGYASNHVLITPQFPDISPSVAQLQTVNLPVRTISAQKNYGYHVYTTKAKLAGITSTVTSYPVSVTYTASPGSLITPASVTCYFNKNGTIKSPCPTFRFTAPVSAASSVSQGSITATSTWDVVWTGSADYGEVGWTKPLPGADPSYTEKVTVQEIQTIN